MTADVAIPVVSFPLDQVTAIQGDMQHEDRDRVVREFRNGTTKILIATDVLSRGFDVSQVGNRQQQQPSSTPLRPQCIIIVIIISSSSSPLVLFPLNAAAALFPLNAAAAAL